MVTLEQVKANTMVQAYMRLGNEYIGTIGAIEHNLNHAEYVSMLCYEILEKLGYSEEEAELGSIAGYLHDIGNLVNRYGHGMSGALLAFDTLMGMGMEPAKVAAVMGAIGNHEEHAGGNSVNIIGAALMLADKSDVHRSRVRKHEMSSFTPRDRVNYAVTDTNLLIDAENMVISLEIEIDTQVCSVMEYFEIFLTKMLMCRRAAQYLNCEFALVVNRNRLL